MSAVFDTVASSYDDHFTFSQIGRLQRQQVWQYLDQNLPKNQKLNILEISCGTGEDAIFFAQKGHQITATDIAPNMVKVTQQKAIRHGFDQQITAITSAAQDLQNKIHLDLKYDFIFSNFGGLNCLSTKDLESLSKVLKQALVARQKSRFVAVIMPSFCAWESLYFLLKLQAKKAFRRSQKAGVLANVGSTQIRTYYYSPRHFAQLFSAHFTVKTCLPIGITLPPSYLEPFFKNKEKYLHFLYKAEKRLQHFGALAYLSDHYLIDFELNKDLD